MISKALDVMHTLHSFLQAIIHNQSPFVLHQISSFMHWLTEKFVWSLQTFRVVFCCFDFVHTMYMQLSIYYYNIKSNNHRLYYAKI